MRIPGVFYTVKRLNVVRTLLATLIAVGIFWLGWGVGSGNLAFGPSAAYRKSEQKNLPTYLNYSSIDKLYNLLKNNYDGQLDVNKLLDGLSEGLAKATGDPYTEYFNSEAAKQFNDELNGTFTGIGAELAKDSK
ncbi:hypothetical protein HY218_02455, partial [Candidatus Saccharibacteria bacterium]|nr:hypothetical protein [Candidatus Saccharibacteria bacterium]